MIRYLTTSIFDSEAQTLVNPVNTDGVMGAGLAREFKWRWPEMFRDYEKHCKISMRKEWSPRLWKGELIWILNFPTKTAWRLPSSPTLILAGLAAFEESYEALGVTSVAFPALGCSLGGLKWKQIKPLMEGYLGELKIPVDVHLPK